MDQTNLAKLEKKIKKELDEGRYRHTMGVMYTSASLAMRYGANLENAQLAGLLHDCAKCIPNDRKLKLCEKNNIPVTEVEKKAVYLLHAKLGAFLAEHTYGVSDQDVLGAIRWHTTGKPDMSVLEKIVFTADYIEPMRFKAANLASIRRTAFEDLDLAVYMILRDTLDYLHSDNPHLDETTLSAFRYYKQLIEERDTQDYRYQVLYDDTN